VADKFPGDLSGEIAALRAEVDELKALIKNRPALTKASTGWRMTDMDIPSVPAGEVHIGSNDGDLYVATSSEVKRITPITPAADVGGMSGLSTPNSWPSTYNPATGGLVQDDLDMIRTWVLQMRTNLRAANLMA
jgi:hypothetical protein